MSGDGERLLGGSSLGLSDGSGSSGSSGRASALPPGTRRVLVTGGSGGIGRAVALALARAGGQVAITGRSEARLAEVVAQSPDRIFSIPCDLSSSAERDGLLPRARELLGGLDGLVCTAGIAIHQRPGQIGEQALRSQLEVNLVAPLRLGERALELLDSGGAVVFVASTLAERPIETSAVYSATKAGLLAAMRSLALAGASRALRFNAVSPGVVDTAMSRALRLDPGAPQPPEEERRRLEAAQFEALRALHPLGRLGTADEVAGAVLHLLAAPWSTGTVEVIDGGLLLGG